MKLFVSPQDSVLTEAAALILLKALDYSHPDEAGVASNLMMDYYPDALSSEMRQAFLMGMCDATDLSAVLWGLRTYSQEADRQPQVYSAVLQRLTSTPGAPALLLGVCHCDVLEALILTDAHMHEGKVLVADKPAIPCFLLFMPSLMLYCLSLVVVLPNKLINSKYSFCQQILPAITRRSPNLVLSPKQYLQL